MVSFSRLSSASLLVLSVSAASNNNVDPQLMRSMKSKKNVNIVVKIKGGVDAAVLMNQEAFFTSRTQRIESLRDTLEVKAKDTQRSVMKLLQQESMSSDYGDAESFWISNSVYITDASPSLIDALSKLPEVGDIHAEHFVTLDPITGSEDNYNNTTTMDWGIPKIGADQVWANGNLGQGVIVGSIDTGVRGTHEALKSNYVGKAAHGWFDPYAGSEEPTDDNGHGTHTMATIVGANGVGVAPSATWLSCKGCSSRGCTEKALLACGQFILCPTDVNGQNPDCSKAPHVSSNSWGGGQGQNWYMDVVKAWQAAGITPIFANGNSGPACRTANSPGDYDNVIGVGATTSGDTLASFSSVGPSVKGLLKPDVSAPGQNVKSAWHTGDAAYNTISGTSMACPHVAGVVALLKSFKKDLSYDQIFDALTQTASTELKGLGRNCGRIQEATFPNNAFGHGQVQAHDAITYLSGNPDPNPRPTPAPPAPQDCRLVNFRCVPAAKCEWNWPEFKCLRKA